MGTRSVFTRQADVQLITENFIPVALDMKVMDARQDAEGEFFRRINDGRFTWASGRIHGMTAEGKFLCGVGKGDYHRDCDPAHTLAHWKNLPEAERKPGAIDVPDMDKVDPRVPMPSPGTLIVQAYQSRLDRDDSGALARCKALFGESAYPHEPGHDFLWLTEAEWKSLIPAEPTPGDRFPMDASLAERIVRQVLRDGSEACPVSWRPDDVRSIDLTLSVESATPTEMSLRLEGSVLLAESPDLLQAVYRVARPYHPRLRPLLNDDPKALPRYEAGVLGRLTYDRKEGRFTRFDVVALGEYVGRTLNPYRAEDRNDYYVTRPYTLGVAFELSRPDLIVPPSNCRMAQ